MHRSVEHHISDASERRLHVAHHSDHRRGFLADGGGLVDALFLQGEGLAVTVVVLACLACVGSALTGCQVDVGGQTLPSAYYLQDDIQYFPAGPEFKLSREAAAQKAYRKEMAADESAAAAR